MIRGYRVWDNQEKAYSDKAFSIDQLGICYVKDEDGYWEEIDDSRFIVEFETGLIGKNGKEIYEGDIVKFECGDQTPAEVVYREGSYFIKAVDDGTLFYDPEANKPCPLGWFETYGLEVIGNIHEPPKDFRPEHLKRMGVSISKGGKEWVV